MSEFIYDLIIVGGGIPGLTLACGLRGSGLRVAVIEAQSEQAVGDRPRAYALSPLSAKIFRKIGIWEQIAPAITHFSQVVLSDADYPHQVVFTPADLGEPAVYYCAEHRVLQKSLRHQASIDPHITCYYETQVQTVIYSTQWAEVIVEMGQRQQHLSASLVVAADGVKSRVRQQAGIKTNSRNYWQSCITAFVSPAKSHQNIAHERFWPDGPFAILPLPDNRCQIVWVAPHQDAEAIAALPPDQFIAAMECRYGDHSGSLTLLSEPLIFPARLMHSRRYCQPRLALLGDAAHHCHPVGGQGLNLGIRDAAMLAQVLSTATQQQQDLGDIRVLQRYGRRRRFENWVMLLFTDILNRTFSNRWLPMMVLRRWVLQLMIGWSPLRRLMLHLMTGFWGTRPADQFGQLMHASRTKIVMSQHSHPEPGTLMNPPQSKGGTK
ncbi:FAD-dependent hydroxylase [Picosynechococcus sp. PCC 73109]|uniref:FAD-dependent hydroxylase n=1 Tax=Picosynechococcus sp. PCC 73109 TaxID=374982 RepID=UPI00090074B3|nr:FAD-dependent hydroxylase [Picosynechococcus sp. PCC 73109]